MPISTINSLANRIASADPLDSTSNQEILEALINMRGVIQSANNATALEGLDGAILMLNFHLRTEGMGGSELMKVLCRIVQYVQLCMLQSAEVASTRGALKLGEARCIDPVAVVGDMQLGQILLSMGHIDEHDINLGLAFGRDRNLPFGEALVQNKKVSQQQVQEALSYQDTCRRTALAREAGQTKADKYVRGDGQRVIKMSSPEGPDQTLGLRLMTDVMLGAILMRDGKITQQQLDSSLLCQRVTGMRLGEALVESGACSWNQVETALELQAKLRRCG